LIEELLWIVIRLVVGLRFWTCKFETKLVFHLMNHLGNKSNLLEIGHPVSLKLLLFHGFLPDLLHLILLLMDILGAQSIIDETRIF
jgi:hypothetical protein